MSEDRGRGRSLAGELSGFRRPVGANPARWRSVFASPSNARERGALSPSARGPAVSIPKRRPSAPLSWEEPGAFSGGNDVPIRTKLSRGALRARQAGHVRLPRSSGTAVTVSRTRGLPILSRLASEFANVYVRSNALRNCGTPEFIGVRTLFRDLRKMCIFPAALFGCGLTFGAMTGQGATSVRDVSGFRSSLSCRENMMPDQRLDFRNSDI
jgi:hypothetical protein